MKKSLLCSLTALFAVAVSGAELFQESVAAPFAPGGHCPKPAAKVLTIAELNGNQPTGYAMRINARQKEDLNRLPLELSAVQCSYDKDYFYFSVRMNDTDIYTEAKADDEPLRKFGDTASVFIKPAKSVAMWEICVSPNGKKYCYLYPGPGNMLPDYAKKCPVDGIKVAVKIDGKLNCSKSDDRAWEVSVAVPRKIFAAAGYKFTADENWQVFFTRTNYSTKLPNRETCSFPQAARNLFDANRYAALKLLAR